MNPAVVIAMAVVVRVEMTWTNPIMGRQACWLIALVRRSWIMRTMTVVAMLHRIYALDTNAFHLVSCRLRMSLDFVHGRSEFKHGSAQDSCTVSVW